MLKIDVRWTAENRSVPLDVDRLWTVGEVKRILAPKVRIPAAEIRLIFAGHELGDAIKIDDCDMGQHSIVHVIRGISADVTEASSFGLDGCATAISAASSSVDAIWDGSSVADIRNKACSDDLKKVHFFVYCGSPCKNVCHGKLRVRCASCKRATLTVDKDPCCWDDVLVSGRITGSCLADDCSGSVAEFYFKCALHTSLEGESCVALYLIRANLQDVPCLACMEVSNPVLGFQCAEEHPLCLSCFQEYCISRLNERRFVQDVELGYTLPCPVNCEGSLIRETHHFRLLGDEHYDRYHRFGAEECLLQNGGVLCPHPGCGEGIIPDPDCRRIVCQKQGEQGCGFVFCKNCLQGYHIGDCIETEAETPNEDGGSFRTAMSQWDDASKVTIKVITKPCPKCRTPTERDGGCMHMVCVRPQCGFHWCWVCQQEWTRDCMGNHWFG